MREVWLESGCAELGSAIICRLVHCDQRSHCGGFTPATRCVANVPAAIATTKEYVQPLSAVPLWDSIDAFNAKQSGRR